MARRKSLQITYKPRDLIKRDIRHRMNDNVWVTLRNLLFKPLAKMRTLNEEFEEEWLTLIFDVPNRPIKNYTVKEEFIIRGRFVRVPRGTGKVAPKSAKALMGSVVTIRHDRKAGDVYDVELDAVPSDATLLTRWFRINLSEYRRIMPFLIEVK